MISQYILTLETNVSVKRKTAPDWCHLIFPDCPAPNCQSSLLTRPANVSHTLSASLKPYIQGSGASQRAQKLHQESSDAIWCPEFSLPLEDTFLTDWHFLNGTDEGGEWGSDWINDPAQISDTSCQSVCPWSWGQSWLYPSDPCYRTLTAKYQPTQMNIAYHTLKHQC